MPDGIILYMADTYTSTPNNFFVLFMRNGNLWLSMQSSSARSRAPGSPTKLLSSKLRYDNGNWTTVRHCTFAARRAILFLPSPHL